MGTVSLMSRFVRSLNHLFSHSLPDPFTQSLIHILFQLKTVYYQTTVSLKECNFDFNIELTKKSEYSAILAAFMYPSANIIYLLILNCNVKLLSLLSKVPEPGIIP